jgi:NADH-quinone oxidoreductase subunit N
LSITQSGWILFFVVMAVVSLAMGNIVAIVQTNVKRLLGYSTISHIGFLFLGLLVTPWLGYGPALYYIVVYAVVVACAFGALAYLSQRGIEVETFDDLKGLSQRDPWMAFVLLVVAFSLAGVPPTVGFYAKFMILTGLVNVGLSWLAALAVVFSIIGAYYYLKIVKAMYFDSAPEGSNSLAVTGERDVRMALSINGLAILALGIFPGPVFVACQWVALGTLP